MNALPLVRGASRQASKGLAVLFTGVLAATCYWSEVAATEWSTEASAALAVDYNDNWRLLENADGSEGWGRHLDLDLRLARSVPLGSVILNPHYRMSRFAAESDLDNDIVSLGLQTQRQFERGASDLALSWRSDTTLTSEVEDTGLTETSIRRSVVTAQPALRYQLAERLEGQLRLSGTGVAYESAPASRLYDYRNLTASGALTFQRSERDSVRGELYTTKMTVPDLNHKVVDHGIRATYSHGFYARSVGTFTLGIHRMTTEREFPGVDYRNSQRGAVGAVGLQQERESTVWKLSLERSIEPSGAGLLVESDRLSVEVTRRMSPFWTTRFGGAWVQNAARDTAVDFDARRYARLTARVFWTPHRDWEYSARYARQWQEYASAAAGSDSNEVALAITYRTGRRT